MSTRTVSGYTGLLLITRARQLTDRLWQAYVAEKRQNGLSPTARRYSVLWIRANDLYVRLNLAYRNNLPISTVRRQKRA